MPDSDPSWDEFITLFRSSGLSLPEDRLPVLFAAFREVRAWGETIRAYETVPGDEPANAYAVASILRAGEGSA
ncbi:hypothetical protein [Acuticoccus kandeliae]|uniref:hypothetical protein n=1 Tax=Acuticoccus kandeliae TaxID=2073160 RepID=UPI000D3E5B8F|nr:hypothetical protein [Acuticoccus kandeliae]